MSRNYDNWENLVTAVLRREKDRYLALLDDLTSDYSTSSIGESSGCLSFKSNTSSILDKPEYLQFSIDGKTEKICFMIGARELTFFDKDECEIITPIIQHRRSRFMEVCLIEDKSSLNIKGSVNIKRLPSATYEAYLVFSFKSDDESPVDCNIIGSSTTVIGFSTNHENHVRELDIVSRPDGFREQKMGSFNVDECQKGALDVLFSWCLYSCDLNNYLIIEGFEFRPHSLSVDQRERLFLFYNHFLEGPGEETRLMDHSDLMVNPADWKLLLPPDKEEIVWKSAGLSFSLDKITKKNCFMIGANELTIFCGSEIMPPMISYGKSRFTEVRLIHEDYGDSNILGSMGMQRLSPKTLYGAYMVFSFNAPGSFNEDGFLSKSCDYLLGSSRAVARAISEYGEPISQENCVIEKLEVVSREDGWKEVKMGLFWTTGKPDGVVDAVLRLRPSGKRNSHLVIEGIQFRPWSHPA